MYEDVFLRRLDACVLLRVRAADAHAVGHVQIRRGRHGDDGLYVHRHNLLLQQPYMRQLGGARRRVQQELRRRHANAHLHVRGRIRHLCNAQPRPGHGDL